MTYQDSCARCGTCCLKGGPSLHLDDLELVSSQKIKKSDLVLFRQGEPMWDNVQNKIILLDQELIKVRSVSSKDNTCIYFQPSRKSCTIYTYRPLQCRVLKCWDTRELEKIYGFKRLSRSILVKRGSALADLILEYEKKCSVTDAARLIEKINQENQKDTLQKINETLAYDTSFRLTLKEKARISDRELDFYFGRPMAVIVRSLFAYFKKKPAYPR
jgi:Fe-S-cluster containining protein